MAKRLPSGAFAGTVTIASSVWPGPIVSATMRRLKANGLPSYASTVWCVPNRAIEWYWTPALTWRSSTRLPAAGAIGAVLG